MGVFVCGWGGWSWAMRAKAPRDTCPIVLHHHIFGSAYGIASFLFHCSHSCFISPPLYSLLSLSVYMRDH